MTVSFAVQFNSIIKYFFPDNPQTKFPRTKIDIEIYIRFIERFHSLPQHAKIKLIKFERIHRRTYRRGILYFQLVTFPTFHLSIRTASILSRVGSRLSHFLLETETRRLSKGPLDPSIPANSNFCPR